MRLCLRALSFLFVMMVALPALAAEAGHVLRIVGDVRIERASGTTSLGVGQPIATGDRIKTGEDARVEIELEGGVRLILGPESRLVVPEQASRAISVVDLLLGLDPSAAGQVEELVDRGTEPVELVETVGELRGEAGMEPLDPEVILLVDHHPDRPLGEAGGPRSHPSRPLQSRQLLAHQVTLMQQLSVQALQPFQFEAVRPAEGDGLGGRR